MTKRQDPTRNRRGMRPVSDLDRFLAKILPEPMSGCELWDGAWRYSGTNNSQLRGIFSVGGHRLKAHRVAWEMQCGPIPTGLHVLHKCDVPLCCRIDHLFLGTHQDNIADAFSKNRMKLRRLGEAHGMSKMTAETVAAIRASNELGPRVAALFGITNSTVHRIRTRRTWKHVP